MELRFKTDFETLADSGQYEDALQDKDFVKRAIKLFDIREKLWKASEKSSNEITSAAEAEAQAKAKWPGRIAFGVIAPVCAFATLGLLGMIKLPALVLAGVAALVGGLAAGGTARYIAKEGPRNEAHREVADMEEKRKMMHVRIEQEIDTMDSQLVSQSPQVREQFRSAFNHASVKEEARLNRLHRAKVEEEVEEAREAAQQAATMSTIAAMNSATAAMRR